MKQRFKNKSYYMNFKLKNRVLYLCSTLLSKMLNHYYIFLWAYYSCVLNGKVIFFLILYIGIILINFLWISHDFLLPGSVSWSGSGSVETKRIRIHKSRFNYQVGGTKTLHPTLSPRGRCRGRRTGWQHVRKE